MHTHTHTHIHTHKGWSLPYTVSHYLGWQSNEVQGQEALEIRVNRSGGIFWQLVKGSNGRFSNHYITDCSSVRYGQGSSSQFCCGQRVKHSNCGIKKFWPTMAMTTPYMGVTYPLHTHTHTHSYTQYTHTHIYTPHTYTHTHTQSDWYTRVHIHDPR